MAKGDDIEARLIDFAVRIIRFCESLPNTPSARHIRGQLLRSGTSPAPNYAEARGAESRRDFIHKLKVVLKELNESRVWLEIAVRANMVEVDILKPLQNECDQLCRIIGSSIQTARNRDKT